MSARAAALNASLISCTSKSLGAMSNISAHFLIECSGAIITHSGAQPPVAYAVTRARAVIPSSDAISSLITTSAAAPSLIEDALPTVTVPSFLNAERSPATDSIVMSARMFSSVLNSTASPFRWGTLTANFSASKRPSLVASLARL